MSSPSDIVSMDDALSLPKTVVPIHYQLTIQPDLATKRYHGKVSIEVDVQDGTDRIILHSVGLNITATSALDPSGPIQCHTRTDDELQTATTNLERPLPTKAKAHLTYHFEGPIRDELAGIYRTACHNADDAEAYIISTHFEPLSARMAFPCFDQPSFRAKFTITIVAPASLVCLGNMGIKKIEALAGEHTPPMQTVIFNTTPPMPTYLVAFAIGDLHYVEDYYRHIPVRVYAPRNANIEHGRSALEYAIKALTFYHARLEGSVPLPKLDLLALPEMAIGAMENWGLMTFRQSLLLFDTDNWNFDDCKELAIVVAHEVAHMWFGNLVSIDSWEDLWLKESFATWMSTRCMDEAYQQWNLFEDSYATYTARALALDALQSSHPVQVELASARQIKDIFDAICYSKGSCIIDMLADWQSHELFWKGVQRHCETHAYNSASTEDLTSILEEVSHYDVQHIRPFIDSWIQRPGYPCLVVTEDARTQSITIRQERFYITGHAHVGEEHYWVIPISIRLGLHGTKRLVLDGLEKTIHLDSGLAFYKINTESIGFYRVFYPADRLERLADSDYQLPLGHRDVAGLISDTQALATAGQYKTSQLLTLIEKLASTGKLAGPFEWQAAFTALDAVSACWMHSDEEICDAVQNFTIHLLRNEVHPIPSNTFSVDEPQALRRISMFILAAGLAGDKETIEHARESHDRLLRAGTEVNDYDRALQAVILRHGTEAEIDSIFQMCENASTPAALVAALTLLGHTTAPNYISKVLHLCLSDQVRSADAHRPLFALRQTETGSLLVYEWWKRNFAAINAKMSSNVDIPFGITGLCIGGLSTHAQLEDVKAFVDGIDTTGIEAHLAQNLELILAKARWGVRDREDARAWFKARGFLIARPLRGNPGVRGGEEVDEAISGVLSPTR